MTARFARVLTLFSLVVLSPAVVSADVILYGNVSTWVYDLDSFGRRITLRVAYATGFDGPPGCSDIDVENVVLVLSLPPDTTLFSESNGSGIYDAGAQTVTWQLGTLVPCLFANIHITIDVDPSVPDGASLQADTVITTTTAGDDPTDNAGSTSFVVGFLPLEVSVTGLDAFCETINGVTDRPGATVISCNTIQARNVSFLPGPIPLMLGQIDNGPVPDIVRTPRIGASVANHLTTDEVIADVEADVIVSNPNPYEVRLHAHRDTYTSCWVDNGGTTDVFADDSLGPFSGFAECGFGGLDRMSEWSFSEYAAEGDTGGNCTLVSVGHSVERGSLDFTASVPSCLLQSVRRFGQRIFTLNTFAGFATFRGHGSIMARWSIGLAGSPADADLLYFSLSGSAPILLRLRDADGREVGAADDVGGPISVAEIAGGFYNGVTADPQEVQVALPEPSNYELDVVGTGAGDFAITLQSRGHFGSVLDEALFTGRARNGSLETFPFFFSTDGIIMLPEPESWLLLAAGVGVLTGLDRLRKRNRS